MRTLKTWLDVERGRRSALAERLGITPGAISQWTQVPEERIGAVSRFTGIPAEQLRPDLAKVFGQPEREAQ